MTENDGFRDHAGTAYWPRTRADLTRTDRCPACFTALDTSVCRFCGLDLTHSAAQELLDVSTEVAQNLDRRLEIIGRIRHETAAARTNAAELRSRRHDTVTDAAALATRAGTTEAASTPRTATPAFEDVLAPASNGVQTALRTPSAPPPPSPPTSTGARPGPPADVPRRSSVQLILLVVGVSALSIGAIAFLVYAFVNYGIVWRSVIIGAVTVAAFSVASLLQRKALRATAEGIAAFAVVLVYLDAYAIRANDLFGAADADGRVYWGVALVAASAGLIAWHRAAGLRIPSIAGFLGFSPGVGVLVVGLTRDLDGPDAACLAFAAAAMAGVVHRIAGRPQSSMASAHAGGVERSIVLAMSVAALVSAALTAAGLDTGRLESDATAPVLAFLGVAGIAVVHVGVLRSLSLRFSGAAGWATAFAVILGLSTSALGFAIVGNGGFGGIAFGGARFESGLNGTDSSLEGRLLAETWHITPVVIAVAVALALEAIARVSSDRFIRVAARPAAWAAALVAAIAMTIPLVTALGELVFILGRSLGRAWSTPFDGRLGGISDDVESVSGLAVVTVLAALAWALTGVLRRRTVVVGWAAAVVLVLSVTVLDVVWAMVAAWFVLAVAALAGLLRTRERPPGSVVQALRPAAIGLLAASTAAGWAVGWSSTATWAIAAALSITIVLVARSLVRPAIARAALLGAATVLLVIAAGTTARQITVSAGSDAWTDDPIRFAGLIAVALLAAAAMTAMRWVTPADRRTVFWLAASVAVGSTLWVRFSGYPDPTVLVDPVSGLVADVLLLVAVLAWVVPAATATFPTERRAASVALAPVAWIATDAIAIMVTDTAHAGAVEVARAVAPAIAALVVAVASRAVVASAWAPATAPTPSATARRWGLRNCRELGVVAVVLAGVSGTLFFDTDATWVVLLMAAVTLVIVSVAQPISQVSAALVGAATLLAIGATATSELASETLDEAGRAQMAAILLLALSAFPLGPIIGAIDRRTIFWVTLVAVPVTGVFRLFAVFFSPLLPAPALNLAVWVVLLAGLLLWAALPSTAAFRRERIVASIAVGPAVYLVVGSFAEVISAPEFARAVVPVTAALLTAAGSLTVALLRPRTASIRSYREIGVLLVGLPSLLWSLIVIDDFAWLVLVVGGITALLTAVSADGLFSSRSNRKQLGWLAIGLATIGLWRRLADDATSAVEPYVLPVAGILLLVALLIWRAGHRRVWEETADGEAEVARIGDGSGRRPASRLSSAASPLILLSGLLTAILPIAAYSVSGAPARAIVVGVASAALLLIGSFVGRGSRSRSARPYLDAVTLAGGIGVLVTSVGRSAVLLSERPARVELDAWVIAGMTVLVVAAFGIASMPDDPLRRQRSIAGQAIAVIALGSVVVLETGAIVRVDAGLLRPFGIVLLFSAVHVLAFLVARPPLSRGVAWLAVGAALVVATAGVGTGVLDPLETGTVPIALALIATGVVHFDQVPDARSWPWLGPGVTLLLLPSLVATIDDRPIWRLVGLGVVGVAVVVIGTLRRLQAPFLIGSVLVLVHAVATFAPQIRSTYESVAWWLWLVIGGIILITLAARYEQRLKNLKGIVERVGALR